MMIIHPYTCYKKISYMAKVGLVKKEYKTIYKNSELKGLK